MLKELNLSKISYTVNEDIDINTLSIYKNQLDEDYYTLACFDTVKCIIDDSSEEKETKVKIKKVGSI